MLILQVIMGKIIQKQNYCRCNDDLPSLGKLLLQVQ